MKHKNQLILIITLTLTSLFFSCASANENGVKSDFTSNPTPEASENERDLPLDPLPEPDDEPAMESYHRSEPSTEYLPQVESDEENEPETESESESETDIAPEYEPETKSQPETEAEPDVDLSDMTPTERLYYLYEEKAPLRWKKTDDGDFVKVYPELSFAYYDIDSGESLTYNSGSVWYSASMIKAPYVYSVFEEIDAFLALPHDKDENGGIIYEKDEEKYNLDEKWFYDSENMFEEGSGEIQNEEDGFELSWLELFDYTLLYSDNVAFRQIRNRFGYDSFYKKSAELGISGTSSGFMNLSADDCVVFLRQMYDYFEGGSELAEHMKDCMIKSKSNGMIAVSYPAGTVAHKYGWDLGAYHDMAIIYDEHPYILVIMTDYEDGGAEPMKFFSDTVELIKEIHADYYAQAETEPKPETDMETESETETTIEAETETEIIIETGSETAIEP